MIEFSSSECPRYAHILYQTQDTNSPITLLYWIPTLESGTRTACARDVEIVLGDCVSIFEHRLW